jgi:hypothetical protein
MTIGLSLGKSVPEEQLLVFPQPLANNVKLGFTEFRPTKLQFKLGLMLELL